MDSVRARRSVIGVIRILAACAAVAGAAQTASAGESLQGFFSSMFGGGQAPAAPQYQPEVAPTAPNTRSRPLTVRLHRPKVSKVAQGPVRPGKVSIFEDRTLRRGDAVMTVNGIRIFAGSRSWPYRNEDFVAIADAGRMDKSVQQTLLALDRLPRR